jgi:hypothetical protein
VRRGALFLAVCLYLAACSNLNSGIATRPLATLPTTLGAVESFFAGQRGGGWTNRNSGERLYTIDGSGTHANGRDECPVAINGPPGTSKVSVITLTCVVTGVPNSTPQQGRSLLVSTAQNFVPTAVRWVRSILAANRSVNDVNVFGGTIVFLSIGGGQLTWDLTILPLGYNSP